MFEGSFEQILKWEYFNCALMCNEYKKLKMIFLKWNRQNRIYFQIASIIIRYENWNKIGLWSKWENICRIEINLIIEALRRIW